MNNIIIQPISSIKGEIRLPGDKSISHRVVMLGSIAEGKTAAINFLQGEDCQATVNCFRQMGVNIDIKKDHKYGSHIHIKGVGLKGLKAPTAMLNVGNSGTAMRILLGILAGQSFNSEINGDMSIQRRPMLRVVDPLRRMGAKISGRENGKYSPLTIKGKKLKSIEYHLPVPSAQVKSSLLLAGLFAEGETTINESIASRDHTERMLKLFGVPVNKSKQNISIIGGTQPKAPEVFYIPGDISSAAFFIVAATIVGEAELLIKEVGINPTRNGIIEVLHRMGAKLSIKDEQVVFEEPKADIEIKNSSGNLKAITISGALIPRLIDEIPIIAVLATQASGDTVIKDARELRVKESDRIATLSLELKKMGAKIKESEDGMTISGPVKLKGAKVESHGDHRIAMALAIAGLVAEGETEINNTKCIETSFPGFETLLQSISS